VKAKLDHWFQQKSLCYFIQITVF